MRGRLRTVHAGLLLVPAAAVAVTLWQGRRPREERGAVLAALRAAAGPELPDAARARAASATPAARYDRDSLYELVDGAAEAYLARGFERCSAATYTFAGALEVAAEVHRFQAEAGARAQLDAERPQAAAPVAGVAGAFSDGSVLVMARGRDLLKLTAFAAGPGGREALAALAGAWSGPREAP